MTDSRNNDRFTQLFQQNYQDLYAYIFALVRDFSDAEDLLQETSVTLWEKFDEFDELQADTSFRAWACTIAKYKALNFVRKQARQRTTHDTAFLEQVADAASQLPRPEDTTRREALQHCAKTLTDTQQRLLWEYYAGKQTVPQIAEQQQKTANSVYGTLSHMRRLLKKCIDRYLSRGEQQ